jgi:hypothetical protein
MPINLAFRFIILDITLPSSSSPVASYFDALLPAFFRQVIGRGIVTDN